MKKEALKSIKKAKKEIRKDLFEKFRLEISNLVDKSGYESKKASKEIKKVANHLAKKLSTKPLPTETTDKGEIPASKTLVKAKIEKEKSEVTETGK
jgi:ribosomal protein S4